MEAKTDLGKTGPRKLSDSLRFILLVRCLHWTRCRPSRCHQWFHGERLFSLGCPLILLFQRMKKNAQAPLSSLYDHNSPLEQLHYTLLLHILRRQGFGFLLDNSHSTPHFRKLLAETVLATDMRVHSQFMGRFQGIVDGAEADPWTRRVLVCQALIKAADISNPVMNTSLPIDHRPCLNNHPVSPYQRLTTLGIRPSRGVDITGHS